MNFSIHILQEVVNIFLLSKCFRRKEEIEYHIHRYQRCICNEINEHNNIQYLKKNYVFSVRNQSHIDHWKDYEVDTHMIYHLKEKNKACILTLSSKFNNKM